MVFGLWTRVMFLPVETGRFARTECWLF